MAQVTKWAPFGVALNLHASWVVSSNIKRTSATQFTVTMEVSWETYYSGAQTNFGMTATSGGKTVTLNPFGTKSSGDSAMLTGTYSISGNGAQNKSVTVTFKNFNTDYNQSATKTLTLNDISVPAWTSYAIKYDANGGSGAPSAQTKWKDQALTLSTTKPTRTGHTFKGWSTTRQTAIDGSATVNYASGAKYTSNAAATLYAVWEAHTYQVIYNTNDGTNAPTAQTKTYGVTLTLTSSKPTRVNYTFKGWATSANSSAVAYASGASYTSNANIVLYAVWELAYTKPRINNFSVSRCDANKNLSDRGTYARVKFTWTTDKTISSVTIYCINASGGYIDTKTVTASGTGNTVDELVGSNLLTTEQTYTIKVSVIDTDENTKSLTLPGIKFAIDFKSGGKGVAFGKPAETENYVDFGFDALFDNKLTIAGRDLNGTIKEAFQPQNENGNTVIGWGNYDNQDGNTNVYGHDINIGVSNIASPGTYRPYRRRGDTITFSNLRTAGYVTNAGADVTFLVPFSVPIIGNPTVTITSNNGFVLRQDAQYTHGSSATTYVFPDSYTGTVSMFCGVYVVAKFSNTTNVVNNAPIGIYWSGTITFSDHITEA